MSMRSLVVGIALFVGAHVANAAPRTIVLATAEGHAPGSAAKELAGIVAHLNSTPELKVVLKTYPSYDSLYAAFKKNEADLMLVGPVKYVEAHSEIGATPIVVEEPKAQESVVIVAKNSPLKSVAELKGKKFAFGYEDSTSTHLLPLLLFSKHGLSEADLSKKTFIGTDQDKIVEAVASGDYDAGAVATVVFEANQNRVRALERSEQIPNGTIVAHRDIDTALAAKLRTLFRSYKATPEAKHERFGHGAANITDADYNKVRFLCRVLLKKTYL